MLRMSQSVTFTDRIQPVCLPTQFPNIGGVGYASGWGRTSDSSGVSSVLKEVIRFHVN